MRSILLACSSKAAASLSPAHHSHTRLVLHSDDKAMASQVYSSPVGPLKLTATKEGISGVKFLSEKREGGVNPATSSAAEDKEPPEAHLRAQWHLKVCTEWLDAYFKGTLLKLDDATPPPRPKLDLPKEKGGSYPAQVSWWTIFSSLGNFFCTVWETLSHTGVGETLSYKELATLCGNPRAARAVGQAVKKHCIPILVPCHRVVKSGRGRKGGDRGGGGGYEVGNYSGGEGTTTKVWLLEHEKNMATASAKIES